MGKNKKIPERLRQSGGRKKAKTKLEVECKISDLFKTKQNKTNNKKTPNPKGCSWDKEWSIRPAQVSCG